MKKHDSEPGYKKGEIIELDITDISSEGEGIGKTDAFTWFIKDTVIGDRVQALVMKTKKNYGYARLAGIISPGQDRVEPDCPIARSCGGCSLQSMSYEAELRFKESKVFNNLLRIGGFAADDFLEGRIEFASISGMDNPYRYRNKAVFPAGRDREGRLIAGFYAGRTHSIIPCEDCIIGVEENSEIVKLVLSHMEKYGIEPYFEESHTGLVRHIMIRKGFKSSELMVCIVINGNSLPEHEALVKELMNIPGMKSISLNINRDRTNVIMGRKLVNLYGEGYINDCIEDIRFKISPLSFYQVNPAQTVKLYNKALEYAELKGGETVWDLYCGIGTISLFMAKKAGRVYGIEIVPQAIEDARANAELNNIKNAEFYVGKAEEVLPAMYEEALKSGDEVSAARIHPDVIVVDPPRKGCDTLCLDTMIKMQPERIVYVSCDPATLARDLRYLCDRGYALRKVQPVDQFARGVHCEVVVLLGREKVDGYVDVDLDVEKLAGQSGTVTYKEISEYVKEKYGLHVPNLYIDQIKSKVGLDKRKNYNIGSGEGRGPNCPTEKEEAIMDAFKYFRLI